jgi:hypothetical protein
MARLAQEIDSSLHFGQRPHIHTHRRGAAARFEHSSRHPSPDRRLRPRENLSYLGDLRAPIPVDQMVAHKFQRSTTVRIVLLLSELLQGEEIVDDLNQRQTDYT